MALDDGGGVGVADDLVRLATACEFLGRNRWANDGWTEFWHRPTVVPALRIRLRLPVDIRKAFMVYGGYWK